MVSLIIDLLLRPFYQYGHVKQIGNKFTKYTKNGAFGFFNRDYFFVDDELITPRFVFVVQQAGA